MVINYIYSEKIKEFPREKEFNELNIFKFLKENLGLGASDVEFNFKKRIKTENRKGK